ncbi:MAG: glycosyltransferase family 2 protein [Lachnospiraceae bacterium]|uniref:glycosyltransferase family 2 protein n=1 Tax=Parablautia sp. Marseille-Q6255 TaxID=3039593 RepID=UPI0024BBF280|nr:glycosyltransferase family 2 protein [Parablautia sp. Marseille-Q6255]
MEATVVIPNYNGIKYLKGCLDSLREQSRHDFKVLLIDNGSEDDSVRLVESHYPEVELVCFAQNRGFCGAVNEGIRRADTPYVILLNNDTVCEPEFVSELIAAMEEHPDCFSCASRMVKMQDAGLIDNAGDYYCALGWAYAYGKDRPVRHYLKRREIFSACAGAAIYRRSVFDEIGLFDEAHFAYLEDVDIAYRAKIAGYHNYYIPEAVVHHVGSATSGSIYNEFKIRHSSRNSIYLVYKNMPWLQILLNLPFLAAGFLIKTVFFARKGYFREYVTGLGKGIRLCEHSKKVPFRSRNLPHYLRIQCELWINIVRRLAGI